MGLLAGAAFLLLMFYLVNSNSFNLGASASKSKYSATGTMVSSTMPGCNSAYTYGLMDPSGKQCTALVLSSNTASSYLGQKVKVSGALKGGVFYVTSVQLLGGDNVTATAYPKPTPDEPVDYPIYSPKPSIYPYPSPSTYDPCQDNPRGRYLGPDGTMIDCVLY